MSEITGSVINYPVPHAYFYQLPPIFQIYSTQTLAQVKLQELIFLNKTTRRVKYVTSGIREFVKCYIKSWVHHDL